MWGLFTSLQNLASNIAGDVLLLAQPGSALVESADNLVDGLLAGSDLMQTGSQTERTEELLRGMDRTVDTLLFRAFANAEYTLSEL